MASHLVNLFFLLILLCLLGHLEEMRIEDLMRMECVRVGVKLLVISLVDPLELAIALGNACD